MGEFDCRRFLEDAAAHLALFGLAGEKAAEVSGNRPGSFQAELYNALHELCAGLGLDGLRALED